MRAIVCFIQAPILGVQSILVFLGNESARKLALVVDTPMRVRLATAGGSLVVVRAFYSKLFHEVLYP